MLIDTHAHLMTKQFESDLDDVLQNAADAGLGKILNVGFGVETSRQSLEMSERYPQLYASVGLHPYDALDLSEELMLEWEKLAQENEKIVAIGETGLDYFKSKVDPEKQKESFRRHLQLAQGLGLPVIVHNRDADEDCLELLGDFEVEAVFHCFGSTLEFAKRVWERGYYTSFTGIVTFSNADNLREVLREMPENRFMVETDCPYLAPQAHRGKRNEPAFVVEVVKEIAEQRESSFDEIVELSTRNALNLFKRI